MKITIDKNMTIDLPSRFAWLGLKGALPKLTLVALGTYGIKETPGPGNTPAIMSWDAALVRAGVLKERDYEADATAWCGLGMAYWCLVAGKPIVDQPLWALNWRAYGICVARNVGTLAKPSLSFGPAMAASLGDILVFARPVTDKKTNAVSYAGHVGTYIAEDDAHYFVLGCNQGDAVSIAPIAKASCVAVRRPPFATAMPASAVPYYVNATGEQPVSLA